MDTEISLTREKMNRLKELGVDISGASMQWYHVEGHDRSGEIDKYMLYLRGSDVHEYHDDYMDIDYIPEIEAFTLQDIMEMLPTYIIDVYGNPNYLSIGRMYDDSNEWSIEYKDENDRCEICACGDLLEELYGMLRWCAENGHLGKKEN